jgi:CheY-like chemotaxis protein
VKEVPARDWGRAATGKVPFGAASADGSALRVLLAEDTPISADMMLAMAARLQIDMDVAANGLEAIEMIEAAAAAGEPYSLLLVDIMMPILDGIETARRLRRDGIDPDELPIIAITAAADLEEVRSYRKVGMQAFLEKPVALADLRATLHAWGHGTTGRARTLQSPAFAALAEQFRQRKQSAVTALHQTIDAGAFSEDSLIEIRRILHQLAGTAGSFGEPALGEAARGFEIELMAACFEGKDPRPVIERAAATLREHV